MVEDGITLVILIVAVPLMFLIGGYIHRKIPRSKLDKARYNRAIKEYEEHKEL